MEDYLKSGGNIERVSGPQTGDFKQRAFANFEGDSQISLKKKNAGTIYSIPRQTGWYMVI
jgi:hypothetical protein